MSSAAIQSEFPIDEPVAKPLPGSRLKDKFIFVFLQLSHRLGAIALLCTLATWAMMYQQKGVTGVLAAAAATAEAGLVFGLIGRLLTTRESTARREANGVTIFNLVLFVLAIYMMVFTRMDVIRSVAGQFFSPTTPTPAENHW